MNTSISMVSLTRSLCKCIKFGQYYLICSVLYGPSFWFLKVCWWPLRNIFILSLYFKGDTIVDSTKLIGRSSVCTEVIGSGQSVEIIYEVHYGVLNHEHRSRGSFNETIFQVHWYPCYCWHTIVHSKWSLPLIGRFRAVGNKNWLVLPSSKGKGSNTVDK